MIPEDWEIVELRMCLKGKPEYGLNAPSIPFDHRFPTYLRITDITEDGCFSEETKVSVKIPASTTYFLQTGDVVFARTGASVGKSYLYNPKDGQLVFAGYLIRLRPDEHHLDSEYLWFYAQTRQYWNWVKANSMRTGQPGINGQEFASLPIPLPPTIEEQQAIAEVLSDVDDLIKSLEQLITKKRQIKHGAMQELLTGKRRLPGFKNDWQLIQLKEIVSQFVVPMRDKPKVFRGSIPWCRIEDFVGKLLYDSKSYQYVDENIIREMNLKVHPEGTLLVSCSADLGRCSIVGRPLITNQTFIGLVFDSDKASNEFFYYYMTFFSDQLNNLSSGTTISYLSREQFENFPVMIPKIKNEQCEIALILSDLDNEIDALEEKLVKTRQVKQGMMQNLMTGRIRLI